MNNQDRHTADWLVRALFLGLFFFTFTSVNYDSYSDYQRIEHQTEVISELTENSGSAIQTTPTLIPEFNKSWITTDVKNSELEADNNIYISFTNNISNTEYKLLNQIFLKIKTQIIFSAISIKYSLNIDQDIPLVS